MLRVRKYRLWRRACNGRGHAPTCPRALKAWLSRTTTGPAWGLRFRRCTIVFKLWLVVAGSIRASKASKVWLCQMVFRPWPPVQPKPPWCDFAKWSSDLGPWPPVQPKPPRCDFAKWSSDLGPWPPVPRCDFARWSSTLTCSYKFNQSLQGMTLADGLRTLTFGDSFCKNLQWLGQVVFKFWPVVGGSTRASKMWLGLTALKPWPLVMTTAKAWRKSFGLAPVCFFLIPIRLLWVKMVSDSACHGQPRLGRPNPDGLLSLFLSTWRRIEPMSIHSWLTCPCFVVCYVKTK